MLERLSMRPSMLAVITLLAAPACSSRDSATPRPARTVPDKASAPAVPQTSKWELDPENSSVEFVCKHVFTNVRGMFHKPSGSVLLDEATPANSKVTATIDVSTISTGVEERDTHLKSPDFFDVAQYPQINFVSTGFTRSSATDYAVTGDPLFSLHYTSSSAEELGRNLPLSQLPSAMPEFFANLVKLPVLVAAALGLVIAVVAVPKRAAAPLALLAAGIVTFVLIGIAGASAIERYLAVAAVALLVFAAVSFGGFTFLEAGKLRTGWMAASILAVAFGVVWTAIHIDLNRFDAELSFRGAAHDDLAEVLNDPKVEAGLRCGPLTLPNHKLVPDSRWIADLPYDKVRARADPKLEPQPRKGVGIYVTSRFALFKHSLTSPNDSVLIQSPPPGFQRVKVTDYYSAYVKC